MTGGLPKFALTAHVVSSVGWLGAVIGVLALAISGVTSSDASTVRASYLAMELITWYVLVPLAFGSLLTGLIQSLSTKWGLFQHYWVVAKLLLTGFATVILLLYTQTISHMADLAQETSLSGAEIGGVSPVLHASAALLILLTTTTLAVFKPRGLTRYGQRKQREQRSMNPVP